MHESRQSKFDDKGFISVSILILMPIFLVLFAIATAGALSIRATEKTKLICRQSVLAAQTKMLRKYDQLISLNPYARLLRAANKASKLSLVIPFYGAASAISVTEARLILNSMQKSIISSANFEMEKDLFDLKLKLAQSLGFSAYGFVQSEILNSPFLAVEAKPKMSLTPDYIAKNDFEDLQLTQIRWTIRLSQLLPSWLRHILNLDHAQSQNLELKLMCASSAKRRHLSASLNSEGGSQWESSLIEKTAIESQMIKAKQFWNLF